VLATQIGKKNNFSFASNFVLLVAFLGVPWQKLVFKNVCSTPKVYKALDPKADVGLDYFYCVFRCFSIRGAQNSVGTPPKNAKQTPCPYTFLAFTSKNPRGGRKKS
jgi:hypothetical protein